MPGDSDGDMAVANTKFLPAWSLPSCMQTDDEQTIDDKIQVVIDPGKSGQADKGKGRETDEGGGLEVV